MVTRVVLSLLLLPGCAAFLLAEFLARSEQVSIPSGTMLHCRTTQTLTTKLNYQGDNFSARVAEPVMMDGREAIPVGATIEGRLVLMERPGRLRGAALMRLTADRIAFPDGRTFPVGAMLLSAYGAEDARVVDGEGLVKGQGSGLANAKEIGGGTAAGSLVGLLFHHPWIGAAVGGTAGLVDRVRRGGKDLTIPAGTQLNYQLTRPLEFTRVSLSQTASR